jgi:hypothetical protein
VEQVTFDNVHWTATSDFLELFGACAQSIVDDATQSIMDLRASDETIRPYTEITFSVRDEESGERTIAKALYDSKKQRISFALLHTVH